MSTEESQAVTPADSQGDLRASHTAADAFNNFASTIEEIVATALAQAGLGMVVNPAVEDGMNPADFAYHNPGENYQVSPLEALKTDIGVAQATADTAQQTADGIKGTADEALNMAKRAMSQAKSAYNQANSALASCAKVPPNRSVAQSDAESPY